MSYEGVKYTVSILSENIPDDPRIDELRKWCKIFDDNNLAPTYPGGTHGNMSFRLHEGKDDIVITAARSSFAEKLTNDSFFTIHEVDFNKLKLLASGTPEREPSSEALLHFAIYKQRPDVQAILHGHCATITKYADQMGIAVTKNVVESGTMEIVESVLEVVGNHSFIEIRDHGFMALGTSIDQAGELSIEMLGVSKKTKGKSDIYSKYSINGNF